MITIFTSVLLIAGCGKENGKSSVVSRDEPTMSSDVEDKGGSLQHGAGYGLLDFDLEIDIDGKDAIDINYEVNKQNDTFEAEYENNIEDFHLRDEDAMNAIDQFFMDVKIAKDKPKEEIIREILEYLNIEGYSKFDLEIKFDDDTTLTIQETT
jgi:hypothetical protein